MPEKLHNPLATYHLQFLAIPVPTIKHRKSALVKSKGLRQE